MDREVWGGDIIIPRERNGKSANAECDWRRASSPVKLNFRDCMRNNEKWSWENSLETTLHKKEWSTDTCFNIEERKHYTKLKKPVPKDHTLYDAIYEMSRTEKPIETEPVSSCQRLGGRGKEMIANGFGVFWGNENVLELVVMVA